MIDGRSIGAGGALDPVMGDFVNFVFTDCTSTRADSGVSQFLLRYTRGKKVKKKREKTQDNDRFVRRETRLLPLPRSPSPRQERENGIASNRRGKKSITSNCNTKNPHHPTRIHMPILGARVKVKLGRPHLAQERGRYRMPHGVPIRRNDARFGVRFATFSSSLLKGGGDEERAIKRRRRRRRDNVLQGRIARRKFPAAHIVFAR